MALTRREFIRNGSLLIFAPGIEKLQLLKAKPAFTVGIVTDVHYADCEPRGTRYYRDSMAKMGEATSAINARKPAFCVCLGDLIDGPEKSSPEIEAANLAAIVKAFGRVDAPHKYVFGNHCVAQLTKKQYLAEVKQDKGYFSFDQGEHHFVVLDACYRKDGVSYDAGNFLWTDTFIPEAQQKWLAEDLAKTKKKAIVFCHQRLDLADADDGAVKSASAVRAILEKAGTVQAVFMGHSHVNSLNRIGGIPYVCLHSMVDGGGLPNNAYSVLDVFEDGSLKLEGFGKHANNPMAKEG